MKDRVNLEKRDREGNVKERQEATDDRAKGVSFEGQQENYWVQDRSGYLPDERKFEITAQFFKWYNSVNGTDFAVVESESEKEEQDRESRGIDGLGISQSGTEELPIQLTKAYVDKDRWREIREQHQVSLGDQDEVFSQLVSAIRNKMEKAYPNSERLILLLDGDVLNLEEEDLQQFRKDQSEFLANSGFKEIWFYSDWQDPVRLV